MLEGSELLITRLYQTTLLFILVTLQTMSVIV